jgi:hypothetical protein
LRRIALVLPKFWGYEQVLRNQVVCTLSLKNPVRVSFLHESLHPTPATLLTRS